MLIVLSHYFIAHLDSTGASEIGFEQDIFVGNGFYALILFGLYIGGSS